MRFSMRVDDQVFGDARLGVLAALGDEVSLAVFGVGAEDFDDQVRAVPVVFADAVGVGGGHEDDVGLAESAGSDSHAKRREKDGTEAAGGDERREEGAEVLHDALVAGRNGKNLEAAVSEFDGTVEVVGESE